MQTETHGRTRPARRSMPTRNGRQKMGNEIVLRADAKRAGLKKYFPGIPCPKGHIAERLVCNRECVACAKERDARDTNKAIRTRKSNVLNTAKRTLAAKEKYWRDIESSRQYQNSPAIRETARKWARDNKHRIAAKAARRRAGKLQATPPWVDHVEIGKFYVEARRLTLETGIIHEVDHIHPLQGRNLCGLHVPWNLQILTKSENSRKRNIFIGDAMLDAALGGKGEG